MPATPAPFTIPLIPRPTQATLPDDVDLALRALDRAREFEGRERDRRIGVAYAWAGLNLLLVLFVFGSPLLLAPLAAAFKWRIPDNLQAFVFVGVLIVWLFAYYAARLAFRRRFGPLWVDWRQVFPLPTIWYWALGALFAAAVVTPLAVSVALNRELEEIIPENVFVAGFVALIPVMIGIAYILEGLYTRDALHSWVGAGLAAFTILLAAVSIPYHAQGMVIGVSLTALGLAMIGIGAARYQRVPPEVPS